MKITSTGKIHKMWIEAIFIYLIGPFSFYPGASQSVYSLMACLSIHVSFVVIIPFILIRNQQFNTKCDLPLAGTNIRQRSLIWLMIDCFVVIQVILNAILTCICWVPGNISLWLYISSVGRGEKEREREIWISMMKDNAQGRFSWFF